jgi:hypothetical protein
MRIKNHTSYPHDNQNPLSFLSLHNNKKNSSTKDGATGRKHLLSGPGKLPGFGRNFNREGEKGE